MLCILYIPALLCFFVSIAMAQAPSAPREDEGKALLERTCTKCHKLSAAVGQRNSKGRWSAIVDDMIARGAEATDPEIEKLVDYLATNFGPKVNVNKATANQLADTLEVPKAAASAIVEYREKNGSFKSFEDLRKVPAIDWSALESKKDSLDFSEGK
jgi:competence ComEA-like helix-hairpin-helix protein